GHAARSPLLRGVHELPPSSVSQTPKPWTFAKNRWSFSGCGTVAIRPSRPGGEFSGSLNFSCAAWSSRLDRCDHVTPPSVLSKIPGADTPARSRPLTAVSEDTFVSGNSPSGYLRPSPDHAHVSPRSELRHTAAP